MNKAKWYEMRGAITLIFGSRRAAMRAARIHALEYGDTRTATTGVYWRSASGGEYGIAGYRWDTDRRRVVKVCVG